VQLILPLVINLRFVDLQGNSFNILLFSHITTGLSVTSNPFIKLVFLTNITMTLLFISHKKLETEVAHRAAEVCEQVLTEMGAEVHDDLIQKLSIVGLYLDRLERSSSNRDEVDALLVSMRADFENVIQSVRRISRQLMPVNISDTSLQSSLELLCQNMERPGAGTIHFQCTGKYQDTSKLIQTHLYRIVQELIHNAFRHSSAWHVWVGLKWEPNQLVLEVEDDGTGFQRVSEFINKLKNKHNTLKIRSQVIGATINYSQGKKGLMAKVTCPL
jgi:signal transduction histidine kinase